MKILLFLSFLFLLSCSGLQKRTWELGPFEKPAENPILKADSSFLFYCPIQKEEVKWQKADVFNPAAITRQGKIYVFFRAEDNPSAGIGGRTSRIGIAESTDGIHFTKHNDPVLFPDSSRFMEFDYPGGCEDPRIVESEDGTYVMAYTSWNKKLARLSIATSKDLISWQKQGPAFAKAYLGKFMDVWSKSGSIVTTVKNQQIIATKINGKYWMYWGESFVNLAFSDDLINWTPSLDDKGELTKVISPRDKMFDSKLTEPGPPALLTEKGIVLLYNGKNAEGEKADPSLAANTYSGGQVLFDKNDPFKVLARSTSCFIQPDLPHEVSGQYKAGTTFIEGLVLFNGNWFLYYGTADSMVGLAISSQR